MKNFALTTRSLLALTAFTLASARATPESVPRDDAGLADFIGMTFSADDRLAEDRIRVSLNRGIAVLTGNVATLDQAERAVERTKSVEGVRAAISHLKVSPSRGGDKPLTDEISRRLSGSPGIDATAVTVTVREGTATLDGRVGTWDEQEIARELASQVPGIVRIDNRLEATGNGIRSDRAILWQIQRMIDDDPLYDGLDVTVTVSGGNVHLSGEVGTPGEKHLLVRRAMVTGVNTVSGNGLEVVRSLSMEGMTGKTPKPAATLEALRETFSRDKRLRDASIDPRLDGRLLILAGTAPTAEAKAAAESTARGVPGIGIVVNRIEIGSDRRVASMAAPR